MSRILLVEDDRALRRALAINLRARSYDVVVAETGAEALRVAAEHVPDLVVLDLGLPDMDGLQVLAGLRGWTRAPVVVLSARDSQVWKVDALDAGADDYVTKPFGMGELLARIRAGLRRAQLADRDRLPCVETERFRLDLASKTATVDGRDVRLTPTEWRLVEALVRRPGVLVQSSTLLHEVWGPAYGSQTNYLRVFMAQVRRKLEADSGAPRHFITEPGLGYRFEP